MHFQCGENEPAGPACILTSYVCDSEIDCYDKSDERNCDYSLNKTTDQTKSHIRCCRCVPGFLLSVSHREVYTVSSPM